jgi:hypothetical protein
MASRRRGEFRHEAVRLALTSGLTRTQVASGVITIAPQGHSTAQMPQPLQ